jgi:hypothetical protein
MEQDVAWGGNWRVICWCFLWVIMC